jgi:hypothetical protein
LGWFHYYRELGHFMNIQDLPEDIEAFERFNQRYEQEHFRYAASNAEIGAATRDLLLSFYLPKALQGLGRPFVYSFMDDPLLQAMGFSPPAPMLAKLGSAALRARSWIIRWLPERQSPMLGTRKRRPTYPHGYEIEELGTFPEGG